MYLVRNCQQSHTEKRILNPIFYENFSLLSMIVFWKVQRNSLLPIQIHSSQKSFQKHLLICYRHKSLKQNHDVMFLLGRRSNWNTRQNCIFAELITLLPTHSSKSVSCHRNFNVNFTIEQNKLEIRQVVVSVCMSDLGKCQTF